MRRHLTSLSCLLFLALSIAQAQAPSKSAFETDPTGWTDIMPDELLTGWTRIAIPPTGWLEPKIQWKVDTTRKVLICEGDGGHEYFRYDKELGDFIYHVEWRFVPIAPLPTGAKPRYNSGIFARNSALGEVWVQAQTGDSMGFLFGVTLVDGGLKRLLLRDEVKQQTVKPAGEWNTYELHCQGDLIKLWSNGVILNEMKHFLRKGYVGLEAEGYRIEFRNLKVKPL